MGRLDHHSDPDRRQHAERVPRSLAAVLERGAPLLQELIESRALVRHAQPAMFMHRQVHAGRTSMALLACLDGGALEARVVRPHRRIHADRRATWERQAAHVGVHVDPAVVGFDATPEIKDLFEREMNDRPLFHVVDEDGATHTLWLGTRAEELARAFREVREGLLLEGHHRASVRGMGEDVLAMLVPMEQVVARASGARIGAGHADAVLTASRGVRVVDGTAAVPAAGRALACVANPGGGGVSWLSFEVPERFDEAAHQVDAWTQGADWQPGASVANAAIEAQVRAGVSGCVIRIADPDVVHLQALAQQGSLLPAASTWFLPRFRSGLCMAEPQRDATTISR